MHPNITLITSPKCWMEQTALTQLEATASLPGVIRAVGLPDLHAGRSPIGVAVQTRGVFYPHLIGGDVGCGMSLFETPILLRKYKQDKLVSRLNHIRALEDLPADSPWEEPCPIPDLGTLGGGNHFAEFQRVDTVLNEAAFGGLSIDPTRVLLLAHSGSRRYGQQIFDRYADAAGLVPGTEKAADYRREHENARLWAGRNRQAAAAKLIDWLGYGAPPRLVLDVCHNYLEEQEDGVFLHRKGAVSAVNGPVIIPGSRGSHSYLVLPAADTALSAGSLSHGAGRKWARSLCKGRLRDKYDRDSLRQNPFGGRVVCHDGELLLQEAPEAYKNIEHVLETLTAHGLCTVIATLRPLITYKG